MKIRSHFTILPLLMLLCAAEQQTHRSNHSAHGGCSRNSLNLPSFPREEISRITA